MARSRLSLLLLVAPVYASPKAQRLDVVFARPVCRPCQRMTKDEGQQSERRTSSFQLEPATIAVMKRCLLLLPAVLLAACGGGSPPPDRTLRSEGTVRIERM